MTDPKDHPHPMYLDLPEDIAEHLSELENEHPCGDYPAPCNCDDPDTHNGHNSSQLTVQTDPLSKPAARDTD